MIDFIGNNIKGISYWFMFLMTINACVLLYRQKNAYRKLADMQTATLKNLLSTETEYNEVISVVTDFIDEHNFWHDRKISFYYDQNGWHCCYADEMPQGDTFTEQEEITPQNENNDENQQSI